MAVFYHRQRHRRKRSTRLRIRCEEKPSPLHMAGEGRGRVVSRLSCGARMASPPPGDDEAARALALEQCERDFNAVIDRMLNLNLDGDDAAASSAASPEPPAPQAAPAPEVAAAAAVDGAARGDRGYWVETMMRELWAAASMDDARERGARVLDAFGAAVGAGAAARLDAASRQIGFLKRAVLFHHRLRTAQEKAQRELRWQLDDYREQVQRLEASNYALSLHLRQADLRRGGGGGGAMPHGPGNPEIF
ncbi:uncharacterized protein LOC127772371 [Oryza glaberrima]|nr:uncharacterized protein LOC127772371 [Oryza glaberrima]